MEKNKTIEVQNHEYCQETMKLKHSLELHFLEMGKRLMEIRDNDLFKPYWDSFTDYLMEMKWDRSRGNRIINIYKTFVLQYEIEPKKLAAAGGWSILSEVLPLVKDKQSAEKWVQKASMHPQYELRDEVREARGLKTTRTDKMSKVPGTLKLVRDRGAWKGWRELVREDADMEPVPLEYGPFETLDELLHAIKEDS